MYGDIFLLKKSNLTLSHHLMGFARLLNCYQNFVKVLICAKNLSAQRARVGDGALNDFYFTIVMVLNVSLSLSLSTF